MREERRVLEMNKSEHGMVITALNDMRNEKLEQRQPTDFVEEVLMKAINAPSKKVRVWERDDAR